MDNMSLADIAAVTNKDKCSDGFFGEGGFFWIVVLFLAFGMMGGGLWGNNNGLQGALTRGEMADGFNTAQILRNQSDITRDQFGVQRDILENRFTAQQCCCQTQQNIIRMGYENQLGQKDILERIQSGLDFVNRGVERGFSSVAFQAQQDKCDVIRAGQDNTQRVIDTLNLHWQQELQQRYNDARLELSQQRQNAQLIAALKTTGTTTA